MTKDTDETKRDRRKRQPYRVRLPGFLIEEEVGLGDTIKRAASYFGMQPCRSCDQRRVALNRWMMFGKGQRR